MGLMDKVKAQATQLAEKAQEAGKVGQAKLGTLQTKKQADNLLRELGAHHFAKAKGRGDRRRTRRSPVSSRSSTRTRPSMVRST